MTELQKQNLSSLIQTSPILNEQERGEWLMLLDLMNDKQIGELEKILKPAVVAPPFVPVKPAPAFVPPPVVPNLPLKHIVNLPNSAVPKPQPVKPPLPKPAPDKTFSKFAEHLNKILAEKDLPASQPQKDLPPAPPKPIAPPKPAVQPKPVELPKIVEKPKTLEQVLSSAPPVAVNYDRPPTPEDLDELTQTIVKTKPKAQPVRAGLQNQDVLFHAAVYKQPKPAPPPATGLGSSIKLEQPDDAAQLQPQNWLNQDHVAITQALKKVVGKFGYHQVIFNLQKSPLYALYIDTGLKSLESPKRFEALGQNFLNKKQFEDFTDLLRELQV